jgi:two-component sensor histidine kinase
VGLLAYLERVCRSISEMSGAARQGWTITARGDDVAVSVDDAIALGAVVNELVANAAKYAFDGTDGAGRIRVAVADRGSDLAVTVSDNGSGIDERDTDPKSTGLGMRLVEMYLGKLGGDIERETGPRGTSYHLRIPRTLADEVASSGRHGHGGNGAVAPSGQNGNGAAPPDAMTISPVTS